MKPDLILFFNRKPKAIQIRKVTTITKNSGKIISSRNTEFTLTENKKIIGYMANKKRVYNSWFFQFFEIHDYLENIFIFFIYFYPMFIYLIKIGFLKKNNIISNIRLFKSYRVFIMQTNYT